MENKKGKDVRLYKEYAKEYDVPKKYSKAVIESVFRVIAKIFYIDKKDVAIRGFGTFKHKTRREKAVRHPATGKIIVMPSKDYMKFIPSSTMLRDFYEEQECDEEDSDEMYECNLDDGE